ncbi:MAG: ParB/RepB/Spo0J family partition protein [Actinobacteria bacterium]|nr:ParB/RepB/Spo0J family partition protein [Actinomycetota bacterium]
MAGLKTGKGLSSLIPGGGGVPPVTGGLTEVAIASIELNPHQPRTHFAEESLNELAASIRAVGVLQPLLVRTVRPGTYQLIAGERRMKAAQRAGLTNVPVIVRDATDAASAEQALIENVHREDLGPLEEAAAYQQLLEDFGLTHDQLASRVGKNRATISNAIRLLGLPASVQQLIADRRLTAGHAKVLLSITDRAQQERVAQQVVREGLSVRATEALITTSGSTTRKKKTAATSRSNGDPALADLAHLIGEHLSTRAVVNPPTASARGALRIEFADVADLERIARTILGA